MENLLRPLLRSDSEIAAAKLLKRFGTIGTIIDADPAALVEALDGDSAAAAAIVGARMLMSAGYSECFNGPVVDILSKPFRRYLVSELQSTNEERILALFLDRSGAYLGQHRYTSGSPVALSLRTRTLVHRMLDIGAHGLILAHNHPSGEAVASAQDYVSTQKLREIIQPLDITLVDHLIVARGCIYSMQRGELL